MQPAVMHLEKALSSLMAVGETEAQVCGREGPGWGPEASIWKWVRAEPVLLVTGCGLRLLGRESTFLGRPPLRLPLSLASPASSPPDFRPLLWPCQGPAQCPPGSVLHCRDPVTLPVPLPSGLSTSCQTEGGDRSSTCPWLGFGARHRGDAP